MHLFEDWVKCLQGSHATHKKHMLKLAKGKQTRETDITSGLRPFTALYRGSHGATKVENSVRKAAAHLRYLLDVSVEDHDVGICC